MNGLSISPPDDTESAAFSAVAGWLVSRRQLLMLTHERPDGDALGSLLGWCRILADSGRTVTGFLRQPIAPRFSFLPGGDWLCLGQSPQNQTFDGVICLDSTSWERTDRPAGLPAGLPLLVLDHHADNQRFGAVNCVLPDMAATAQLLARLARFCALPLGADAASCLLTGMAMDTGGFHFANVKAEVLRDAAFLLDAGADYAKVMEALFFREPLGRRRLAARLLERAVFACDGRFVYSVLQPEWFTELGVAVADTEGLIDALRVIDSVEIACVLQPEPGAVRLSLRGRSLAHPVSDIAHELGGGGHPLAAGVKLPGVTLADAEARIRLCVGKALTA